MKQLTFTIFGGTGDLTFRKLLPALYNLQAQHTLEEDFSIVIIGRREYDHDSYCAEAAGWIKQFARLPYRDDEFLRFANRIHYVRMDFTKLENYEALNTFYKDHKLQHHVFYFAVAPRFFAVIAQGLVQVEKACKGKVIIEKPFG